jgi:hypothetical protein
MNFVKTVLKNISKPTKLNSKNNSFDFHVFLNAWLEEMPMAKGAILAGISSKKCQVLNMSLRKL